MDTCISCGGCCRCNGAHPNNKLSISHMKRVLICKSKYSRRFNIISNVNQRNIIQMNHPAKHLTTIKICVANSFPGIWKTNTLKHCNDLKPPCTLTWPNV